MIIVFFKWVKLELKSNSFRCIHFPNNGVETFHKISKQWNEIFIQVHSVPLHSIVFHFATLRSVPSIQTELKSLVITKCKSMCQFSSELFKV